MIAAPRTSPWHDGERRIQQSLGIAERMNEVGPRVIRNYLLEQHRNFYPLLPFVVLGTVDPQGDAWATVRTEKPGFLHAPDTLTLHAALPRDDADPAEPGLADGQAVGLLGIELHTRRRNRLNGFVRRRRADGFDIDVRQSFGNCPQYITPREFAFAQDAAPHTAAPAITSELNDASRAMIAAADTFFVASYVGDGADRQVDVSHRGGPRGFIRVDDAGVLTIPDYAGNRFFNTLGNLISNPKAGLAFVDFASGTLLQMSGDAEVILDPSGRDALPGAERVWRFRPRLTAMRVNALPMREIRA